MAYIEETKLERRYETDKKQLSKFIDDFPSLLRPGDYVDVKTRKQWLLGKVILSEYNGLIIEYFWERPFQTVSL